MENRGVGYGTDMERGRKKEGRKKYTLLFSPQHTHSQLSLTHCTHTMTACLSVHSLFAVTQDAYLLHAHILLVFSFLSILPFFLCDKPVRTYTPLWGDWCCKLAWVCRWSGCDYCLALRQLWWWHSVLWAPLAWASSKHNQAVHSLYLTTVHTCGLDSTETHTCCVVPNILLHSGPAAQAVKLGGCLLWAPADQMIFTSMGLKVSYEYLKSPAASHTRSLCPSLLRCLP